MQREEDDKKVFGAGEKLAGLMWFVFCWGALLSGARGSVFSMVRL